MTQYAFFFDQSRCYGCNTCAHACKNWKGIKAGPEKLLRIFTWEKGAFPSQRVLRLFAPCYHCESPKCVSACPSGAIYKEDKYGAVLVDQDKCDGCRKCFEACDYGAPQFSSDDPKTKMSKCDLCIDRLESGDMPICTLACPMRSLDFGPLEKMQEKYGKLRELEEMPAAKDNLPAAVFRPARDRIDHVPYDAQYALELFGYRGEDLEALYTDQSEVTIIPDGIRRYDKLNMKPKNSAELMYLTGNDEG